MIMIIMMMTMAMFMIMMILIIVTLIIVIIMVLEILLLVPKNWRNTFERLIPTRKTITFWKIYENGEEERRKRLILVGFRKRRSLMKDGACFSMILVDNKDQFETVSKLSWEPTSEFDKLF